MPHPFRATRARAATAMPVLTGLAWLLLCQRAGELLARLLHLPLPGPVAGMLLRREPAADKLTG